MVKPSPYKCDSSRDSVFRDGTCAGVGDNVGVGILRERSAVGGAVPLEVLVVRTEHHCTTAVEDGNVEFLQWAGADNRESVIGALVGREDVGTVESKRIDGQGDGSVDIAANLIITLHRDDITVGSIDVEMMGDRLACGA